MFSSSDRAKDLFSSLQNVINSDVSDDVKKLSDAFASSEFLNNRAFSVSATSDPTVTQDIARRTVTSLGDDLSTILELDYAATDDESSVISPAAYFYDLMRIVMACINISGTAETSAKYSLLARRPDLLDIPLDKANTTTDLFPSLAIVNYVLARQLMIKDDATLLPSSTKKIDQNTYATLMSSYEKDAFDKVKALSSDVFHLPFDLDFESHKAYLSAIEKPFFDLSSDVADIMKGGEPSMTFDLAKAYLGLSQVVVAQLTSPKIPKITTNPVSPASGAMYSVDSATFCKEMHISYERLGELLHLNPSDSAARKYVAALGEANFYVNQGTRATFLKFDLTSHAKTETLANLTNDRVIRIGLFHFMSKQLGIDCDELELLFSFLGIGSSISSSDIVNLALLRKLQKENNLSTITLISMFVDKTQNETLYTVVMEKIRTVKGPMAIWELHWKLLPAYLMLLSSTKPEGIDTALTSAGTLLSSNASLLGYADVFSNLGSTKPQKHDYFTYYANQTLTYLSRVSGVNLEEIRTICLKTPQLLRTTETDVDSFIQSIYTLGQLKKSYNRTLVELCQLACFTNAEAVEPKTADDVIAQGIPLLLPNKFDTLHVVLPQHAGSTSVQFLLAPVSQDIFVILKSGTASTNVEVHVLSAMSGYQSFSGSFVTSFPSRLCSPGTEFLLAKNNDLYIVLKSGSDIQVHCLSANDQYKNKNSTTIVQERLYDNKLNLVMCCGSSYGQFMLSPDTNDLYFVYKSTGRQSADLYAFFFKDTDHPDDASYAHQKHGFVTGIPACGAETQFFLRPNNDIAYVLRKAVGGGSTGTKKSELHIFKETDGVNVPYEVAVKHTGTFFEMCGPECQFLLGKNGDLVCIKTSTTDNSIAITAVYIQASLTNLLKLNTFNQTAVDQSWDLDDLMLSRFGVLSADHEKQTADIQEGLLQPFFRDLKKKTSKCTLPTGSELTYSTLNNKSLFVTKKVVFSEEPDQVLDGVIVEPVLFSQNLPDTSFIKQPVMTEKTIDMLETNVAKLFGLDKHVFHRLMTSYDDLGYAFYSKLIFDHDLKSIPFMQRMAALIKLLGLKPAINEGSRSQFERIIIELNASVQELYDEHYTSLITVSSRLALSSPVLVSFRNTRAQLLLSLLQKKLQPSQLASGTIPAFATLNGKLYCAYQVNVTSKLAYTTFDGTSWSEPREQGGTAVMSESPSLVEVKKKLYFFHRAGDSLDSLWYSIIDSTGFGIENNCSDVTINGSPSAVVYEDKLYCFYQRKGNAALCYGVFDASNDALNAGVYNAIPDIALSNSPAAVVFDGKLYCFHKGSSDGFLYYCYLDQSNTWRTGNKIDGVVLDSSPAVAVLNGLLCCTFYRNGKEFYITTTDGVEWASSKEVDSAELFQRSTLINVGTSDKSIDDLFESVKKFKNDEQLVPKNLKKLFNNLYEKLTSLRNPSDSATTATRTLDLPRLNSAQVVFSRARNIDFDDIDVLIELLNFSSKQYPDSMLDLAMSTAVLERLMSYKKAQLVNGDSNASLLQCFYHNTADLDDIALSNFLQVRLADWNNLKAVLFSDSTTLLTTLSDSITRLDKITKLKALLVFFEHDTNLIIAFLRHNNPKFISQHLSQALQKKNSDAYERAARSLNERKRDVLVDAVLRTFHADSTYNCFKLDNPDKLSEYLLIDVLISGEDKQTPIIQAHSTLQWYMRRCVEGIEQDSYDGLSAIMDVSKIREEWWSWIKNYRVWEANRQVFLYPENFLSPDLRINQSEQFQQLSKTLRKPHLDDDAIEDAYLQYVSDLMKLRDLTISAACVEPQRSGSDTRKLHLFAHDNATPSQYYHCTAEPSTFDFSADCEFLIAQDNNDIFVIHKSNTPSGKVEIYVLAAGSFYQKISEFYVTSFDCSPPKRQFMLSKISRDLYCVAEDKTDSTKKKICFLSKMSKYQTIGEKSAIHNTLQVVLNRSCPDDVFYLYEDDKLGCLIRNGSPDDPSTAYLFSLSGDRGQDIGHNTSAGWNNPRIWEILLEPGTNDLVGIKKDTPNTINLNYLTYASKYKSFKDNIAVSFLYPYSNSKFLFKSNGDLVYVMTSSAGPTHTGSNTSEVHILSKESNYKKHVNTIFQNWTFWEKLPLNIVESSADRLKAIFVHNRPYLYWLQRQSTEAVSGSTTSTAAVTTLTTTSVPQVQLFCSYQHLDGSWQAAQLLDEDDWKGFLPGVDSTDATKADQLVFRPEQVLIKIDNHGKYNASGNSDPTPYGLNLLDVSTLAFPTSFSTFLTQLYINLSTQSIEKMFTVSQSALDGLSVDNLWGQYYWELMYFSPLTMANALQTTQQYDKALTWYKGVFNPSRRSSASVSPFVFSPFTTKSGNDILNPLLNTRYLNDLHLHAFEAHLMAQLRGGRLSYKKYTVMQYIQNLIAWGDSLFTDDTRESITEAMGRYLAASDLLGDSPRKLYSAIYDDNIQHKTVIDLFNTTIAAASGSSASAPVSTSTDLVIYPYNYCVASYFHVPENREFMALWSNVDDRLYKIRHCLSITGVKQQLALLSPAIDPHALVRAVAARGGEFVREILTEISGKNRPPYRFLVLLERAKEFASFVERLGDSLLSMLEREENAGLVKLNNDFAQTMLDAMTKQKNWSIDQATSDRTMLDKRQESIQTRIDYYTGLLPNNGLSSEEIDADNLLFDSCRLSAAIHLANMLSNVSGAMPQVGSPFALTYGGEQLKFACAVAGSGLAAIEARVQYDAGHLQRSDGYKRRHAEWQLQLDLANKELEELKIQKSAADIRVKVAKEELDQHTKSIAHQQKVSAYNNTQFTNVDLYAWYADQLYDLLSNAYQLAMRVANQAASAYQYELGEASTASLTGFWSTSRRGLLSGPKLTQQLHQMQQEYLEKNKRLPEIEKTLSLRDILWRSAIAKDPTLTQPSGEATVAEKQAFNWTNAIKDLKTDAGITFTLGADLFKDFSKRTAGKLLCIKMLSVSVPALAGPNQQVNLLLTNTSSGEEIYISRGVSATGMFSASLDDARYLPFEGQTLGDNSKWTLSVGEKDSESTLYDSIPDIQLRVLYVIRNLSTTSSPKL